MDARACCVAGERGESSCLTLGNQHEKTLFGSAGWSNNVSFREKKLQVVSWRVEDLIPN
jgi:hypothetical protein